MLDKKYRAQFVTLGCTIDRDTQPDEEIEGTSMLLPRSCPTRSQTLTYGGVVKLIVV